MTRRIKLILELNVPEKFGTKADCPDSYLANLIEQNIRAQFVHSLNELRACTVIAFGQDRDKYKEMDGNNWNVLVQRFDVDVHEGLITADDFFETYTLSDFAEMDDDFANEEAKAGEHEETEDELGDTFDGETEAEFTELEDQDDGDIAGLHNEMPDF